ncbi:hypothetical protein FisN_1Hh357 [Fistulifera solaris]|uniref:DUF501 domain-containing protein n=1 Tax=Fistulifera solaris TaxID=1519565 RepID=A0A1Z5JA01_FISSO|nr:hypothetical protein FisN_1Hh357 [Fistulifera solaris]|eukprot:GAX10815.1 hypothetical protein FisN_1Hh357 [Fistulifera solaris]
MSGAKEEPTESSTKLLSRAKGRAARQRRRKLRDIQEAEEALREGRSSSASTAIPSDRSAVWPAVLDCRTKYGWSREDEMALVGQLGYLPGNAIRVCARASAVPCLGDMDGTEPVVLKLYPIAVREECSGTSAGGRRKARKRTRQVKDIADESDAFSEKHLIEPFPTMYWVTSPMLRILISKLELESFGVKLKEKLESETESLESMKRAHMAYGKARKELLSDSDDALIMERKWESAFAETRGVAGLRHYSAIKCLHAHAAHFLSGENGSNDNVVGRWVIEEVERRLREEGDS